MSIKKVFGSLALAIAFSGLAGYTEAAEDYDYFHYDSVGIEQLATDAAIAIHCVATYPNRFDSLKKIRDEMKAELRAKHAERSWEARTALTAVATQWGVATMNERFTLCEEKNLDWMK